MGDRRQNFQNISWLWDLRQRDRLDMDPPYQRRSIWSERYRQQFIDTILLDYPAPAIFLFSRIDPQSGLTKYELVDGKQRLTAIFDFLEDQLAIGDDSPITNVRGKYFSQLSEDERLAVYEYDFAVEYLPTNNEEVINNIFNRLNRNVAKLTAQELRHAQFDGAFIDCAERLADWMKPDFESYFPRIAPSSRRQMKDVEFVATLLLLLEEGPKSYSVSALDKAFSDRDETWDKADTTEAQFRKTVDVLRQLPNAPDGAFLTQSRFRNQADYYSLFGAIARIESNGPLPDANHLAIRLFKFQELLEDEKKREQNSNAQTYFEAARSASNDAGPRSDRIKIMEHILAGKNMDAPA